VFVLRILLEIDENLILYVPSNWRIFLLECCLLEFIFWFFLAWIVVWITIRVSDGRLLCLVQASRQHLPIPSFVETRQERGNAEAAAVAAVEQSMKKCMDDLMRMMESVTGRIGQLESSTRRLEQMVTDLKSGSELSQGASGGKLLLIETMLSEVWDVKFQGLFGSFV
jgi:hypothetical protein